MRNHGTLVKWNDERGFGFIAPAQGNEELFVHVSAFRRGGARPTVNELVSFEVRVKPDGKKEAINVMRAGESSARVARHRPSRAPPARSGLLSGALTLAAMAAIAWYGYDRYSGRFDSSDSDGSRLNARSAPAAGAGSVDVSERGPAFVCDGRRHCSQMKSCEEARFFLRHCPDTQMDGDNDGEPCEQQCG